VVVAVSAPRTARAPRGAFFLAWSPIVMMDGYVRFEMRKWLPPMISEIN
jgi:hypothetical protein